MFRILALSILENDRSGLAPSWIDLEEGPFASLSDAITFADCEVGTPWLVVDNGGLPQAYGDANGLHPDSPSAHVCDDDCRSYGCTERTR